MQARRRPFQLRLRLHAKGARATGVEPVEKPR